MSVPNGVEDAARDYMARGWAVFPVKGKIPCTSNGVLDASTEERLAAIWFERFPDRGVALATGKPSGVWVVDLDGPDAVELFKKLRAEAGDDSRAMTSITNRGYHLFYEMPNDGTDIRNSAGKIGPGIDVRGTGGYVVLPPSPHPDGPAYRWAKGRGPKDYPPESVEW